MDTGRYHARARVPSGAAPPPPCSDPGRHRFDGCPLPRRGASTGTRSVDCSSASVMTSTPTSRRWGSCTGRRRGRALRSHLRLLPPTHCHRFLPLPSYRVSRSDSCPGGARRPRPRTHAGRHLSLRDAGNVATRKLCQAHVHAPGFRIAGEAFAALPTVRRWCCRAIRSALTGQAAM
jgi:hypothetical protein